MSAVGELRDLAKMFGWDIHADDSRRQDTFLHGQHMVMVDYARDGAVRDGQRYEFASVASPKLRERTRSVHKKDDVRAWLVKLGH